VQVVAPKRAALGEANKKLEGANKKLAGIRARVKELQDKVAALEEGLMKATADKNAAIAQARVCGEELCGVWCASMQPGQAGDGQQ
jgi:dynein heavy chain